MRQNPHVRICGGPGSATTLVYPTPGAAAAEASLPCWPAGRQPTHAGGGRGARVLEQKKGARMPVKSAVGSAAAMREVLEAAYSGTCRDPSRNPTLRGPDTDRSSSCRSCSGRDASSTRFPTSSLDWITAGTVDLCSRTAGSLTG